MLITTKPTPSFLFTQKKLRHRLQVQPTPDLRRLQVQPAPGGIGLARLGRLDLRRVEPIGSRRGGLNPAGPDRVRLNRVGLSEPHRRVSVGQVLGDGWCRIGLRRFGFCTELLKDNRINGRTIGVANGGGDCAGLNAAIRGVVKTAILRYGWRVIGITNGFDGLIWPERSVEMTLDSARGILPRGGTILGTTNHGNPFAYPEDPADPKKATRDLSAACLENAAKMGLHALVVIGGEGTLTITRDLGRLGLRVVGVPKTIDNDVPATEVTFGFDTALHVATDAIDRLHTTAESHGRVMVVEMMGRNAGWIALHSGIAGGADVILIPEIPFRIEHVCRKILERGAAGRKFSIVVVAEGAKLPERDAAGAPLAPAAPGHVALRVGEAIGKATKKEVRVTVLGHIQRGGSPSPFDRILATRYGCAAADLVAREEFGRMVCLHAGKIESVPLEESVGGCGYVDLLSDHVRAARSVGISFGDGN